MRMVKKTWFIHNVPHQEKISYKEALNELVLIFNKCPRETIEKKLSQGIKLGNGKGTLYQVLVITEKGVKKNNGRKKELLGR